MSLWCSVWVVPYLDKFFMYLWGGRLSSCLIPLLSWKFFHLFLILEEKLSAFHSWVWCKLWFVIDIIMLKYGSSIVILMRGFFFFLSWMGAEFCQKLFLHLLRRPYGFYSTTWCGVSYWLICRYWKIFESLG